MPLEPSAIRMRWPRSLRCPRAEGGFGRGYEDLAGEGLYSLPIERLWVNPDCGLQTRDWPETEAALRNMIVAARALRQRQVGAMAPA